MEAIASLVDSEADMDNAQAVPTLDDKGRPTVDTMTTDEMLREIVTFCRTTQDSLERFMATNPMAKMMGRFGG